MDAVMGNAIHIQLAQARGAKVLEETVVQRLEHTTTGAIVSTTEFCDNILKAATLFTFSL